MSTGASRASTFSPKSAEADGACCFAEQARSVGRKAKGAQELLDVVWKPDSNVFHMFGVMKPFLSPPAQPAPPSPFAWGDAKRVEELLGASFELRFEDGTNHFRYDLGPKAFELWRHH
jgi:hypothetical protein